jgi:hypothetical protein
MIASVRTDVKCTRCVEDVSIGTRIIVAPSADVAGAAESRPRRSPFFFKNLEVGKIGRSK